MKVEPYCTVFRNEPVGNGTIFIYPFVSESIIQHPLCLCLCVAHSLYVVFSHALAVLVYAQATVGVLQSDTI